MGNGQQAMGRGAWSHERRAVRSGGGRVARLVADSERGWRVGRGNPIRVILKWGAHFPFPNAQCPVPQFPVPNPQCPIADVMTAQLDKHTRRAERAMQDELAQTTVADVMSKSLETVMQSILLAG